MNALIFLMLVVVIVELIDVPICYKEVVANVLCFTSRASFGYFISSLKKKRCLIQISEDLNISLQAFNVNNEYIADIKQDQVQNSR